MPSPSTRFEFSGNNTIGLMNFRIDADYRDPLAVGAVPPFRVIRRWREVRGPREHSERITALPATYTIETRGDPEMISVTAEMPSS